MSNQLDVVFVKLLESVMFRSYKMGYHCSFYAILFIVLCCFILAQFSFRPFDAKNPFMAPIVVNRELHKSGGRSCMHIELDITGSKLRYDAGDHVAIYPANSSELVEKIGNLLGVDLGVVFTLTNVDGNNQQDIKCLILPQYSKKTFGRINYLVLLK